MTQPPWMPQAHKLPHPEHFDPETDIEDTTGYTSDQRPLQGRAKPRRPDHKQDPPMTIGLRICDRGQQERQTLQRLEHELEAIQHEQQVIQQYEQEWGDA